MTSFLLVIIYVSFISLGLPDSVLGAAWPTMLIDLSLPVWGAGLLQMTVSCFTIISSLNCARLIRRLGTGRLTAISVGMTALALLGFSFARGYLWLLLLAVPLGLGAGAVDASLNNYVALHCEPRHMSWLHCFWGVGTIAGPMILTASMSLGFSWPEGYRMIGLLQCALCAVLFATLGQWKHGGLEEEEKKAKALSVPQVLALPGAKQGMLTFLCYCAAESTLILWAPTYMVLARGMSEMQAASCGSLFCLGITLGRAASGFMTYAFTPRQMVRLGQGVLAAGCMMMFVPVNAVMLAGVVVAGLGCAPIYPNIIQDTPVNYGAENSQAAIGVQMAFAYMGSTFVPTLFGLLGNAVGYGVMPAFCLVLAGAMALLFAAQARIVDGKKEKA
ncbi:MAG: MFS transporter [Clostridia bacterium]|nr:MFS transporter [Clostridia bacterium]